MQWDLRLLGKERDGKQLIRNLNEKIMFKGDDSLITDCFNILPA